MLTLRDKAIFQAALHARENDLILRTCRSARSQYLWSRRLNIGSSLYDFVHSRSATTPTSAFSHTYFC